MIREGKADFIIVLYKPSEDCGGWKKRTTPIFRGAPIVRRVNKEIPYIYINYEWKS